MGLLAAHLNDSEILVVNDEKILYREPGYALLEDDGLITGAEAYASASPYPPGLCPGRQNYCAAE